MNKIKSTLTSGSSKLTSAFKSEPEGGALHKLGNSSQQESAAFNEPSMTMTQLVLHSVAIFFTFLALCTMAAVAAFQAKWLKVCEMDYGRRVDTQLVVQRFPSFSSSSAWFLRYSCSSSRLFTTGRMGIVFTDSSFDKCKRVAQFLSQARSTLILHAFGTLILGITAFIVTISAWGAKVRSLRLSKQRRLTPGLQEPGQRPQRRQGRCIQARPEGVVQDEACVEHL